MSQFRQPGEIATRVQGQGSALGLPGAVLIARRDAPLQSEATDLSNVVPFARPRRHGAAPAFPLPSVAANERPAPHTVKFGIGRGIALLAGSLALHSTLLAMFWHQPRPMASIGVEAMTVEITLGATTAAGVAQQPGEQEVQVAAPSEDHALEEPVTEQARVATVMPQEVPVAPQETAPEAMPQDASPEIEATEPEPQQRRAEPETAVAEITAAIPTTERMEQPRPQAPPVQKAPERKRTAAPTDKKAAQKKQHAAAATDTASGIGRGRSDHSTNYNGKIVAHLARHNPDSARRADAQGVATVSFSIDSAGRVTSVRLVSGSGNAAIDQEVAAMPRRASPFPPPPDGKGRNFTVPVRLNLR